MSASLPFPFVWGQLFLEGVPAPFRAAMTWLFLLGEPTVTVPGLLGALITWTKVISLFCLLGWVCSWIAAALRARNVAKGSWLDIAALIAVISGAGTMLLRVLETTERISVYKIQGTNIYIVTLLALICLGVILIWVEHAVWSTIRRLGKRGDLFVLVGMHVALLIGVLVGFGMRDAVNRLAAGTTSPSMGLVDGLTYGARMSATYMGYVVLAKVAVLVLLELVAVRWRRIFSIAKLCVTESNRRMWAPWVVITVFLVVLAFTHWFLQAPRPAEMGRLYVGTLSLLCSLLLTVMVTLLTPLSLPHDIQHQTIYTVVSKPVRRIELVWGRMIGFMTIVTVLVLIFGGVSLLYLRRTVGGTIQATQDLAVKAARANRHTEARLLREHAEQIRTRMAARVPLYGSLTFLDSKGTPHRKGIDVGAEQSMREPRSHIEGATPATAIWTYGIVPDPLTPEGQRPIILDRRIPIASLLKRDTVEDLQNRMLDLKDQIAAAEEAQASGNVVASKVKDLTATVARQKEEYQRATKAYEALRAQADEVDRKADDAEKSGSAAQAQQLRGQAAALHSPPIALEMTFNIYRTTKGRIGEPVFAEIEVTNPATGKEFRNIFPIREYYTNRQAVPASYFAGSHGAMRVEVRCISPTQYLGMAESDLYILSHSGDFGTNFMKGLFGVWLQAMVLTAIGVFAGTFLSWPVALLTTIAFFIAGQIAFAFLLDFTRQSLLGGGPFESLIRLIGHDNQVSDLTPTLAVVTAKTLDALVMPVMSRLVYIVPNFAALDVSNTVADGFAVSWGLMVSNLLLALAYALPFSVAGYFILKNREVAA
jgi:ABC-type transport system involved in multi-copper enzyme maturation permease subunit